MLWRKRKINYRAALKLIEEKNSQKLRAKIKILIVDDEEFEIINILKDYKFDIYSKKDITYAIEAEAFDIIILDIKGVGKVLGSGMEGFEVAKQIKLTYPSKKVLCYSGTLLKGKIGSEMSKIDGFLLKDMEIEKWAEKLDEVIKEYVSKEYQEKVLRWQLEKCDLDSKAVDKILDEYRQGLETGNMNSFTEQLLLLGKGTSQIIEVIKMIYSFLLIRSA